MEFVVATEASVSHWDFTALITTLALLGKCLAHTNLYLITSGTKVFKSGQWEWSPQQEFRQFCQGPC